MKKYAYHVLKESFVGKTIYPLNQLKNIHPDIFQLEIKKYQGRELLMSSVNPILNCLWNDVVQFSCLDPKLTFEAAKHFNPNLKGRTFRIFALDLCNIKENEACLFTPKSTRFLHVLENDQYEKYNSETFENLSCVPDLQIDRWQEDAKNNKPLLLWSRTKHFFYKSPISLSEGKIYEIHT